MTDLVPGSSLKIRPAHLGIGSRARLPSSPLTPMPTSPTIFDTRRSHLRDRRTVDCSPAVHLVWAVFRAGDGRGSFRISCEDQAVVRLAVHGERLATLVNRRPGTHEFFWDGRSGGSPVKPGLIIPSGGRLAAGHPHHRPALSLFESTPANATSCRQSTVARRSRAQSVRCSTLAGVPIHPQNRCAPRRYLSHQRLPVFVQASRTSSARLPDPRRTRSVLGTHSGAIFRGSTDNLESGSPSPSPDP